MIGTIRTKELVELVDQKESGYVLIDVRTPEEWEEGVIPGVKKVSLHLLPLVLHEYDKKNSYVFICRSGQRSAQAAQYFFEHGYLHVYNYVDGMLGWKEQHLPVL